MNGHTLHKEVFESRKEQDIFAVVPYVFFEKYVGIDDDALV
jgi:hypothetical protein